MGVKLVGKAKGENAPLIYLASLGLGDVVRASLDYGEEVHRSVNNLCP